MLRRIGAEAEIASDPGAILRAERLILPGVGAFDYAARRLRASGLLQTIEQRVLADHVPILGICLGFQLLTRRSDEGEEPGLGWLDADTVRFDAEQLPATHRIPHMGWASLELCSDSPLFASMPAEPRFYFVHSYHVVAPSSEEVIAMATHGYRFAAAMQRGNIMGVQFHPEKSHNFGLRLLRNFVESR